MPIFVSRFSPERSLIGSFLAPRARGRADEEAKDSRSETSGADRTRTEAAGARVEPPGLAQPSEARETAPASDTGAAPEAPPSALSAPPEEAEPSPLTLLEQLRSRRNGFEPAVPVRNASESVRNPTDAPEPRTAPGALTQRLSPLAQRLQSLSASFTASLSAAASEPSPTPATVEALAAENQAASESADAGNLVSLVRALREEASAEEPSQPQVSREEQSETFRTGLREIAEGLRQDAEAEARQTRDTPRTAEPGAASGQQRELQQNRQEIQSLQAERRRAQQDAQRADQAIRQLQSRNSRLQGESVRGADAGTSLDLLAQ
jgi:hypothetical protein